MKAYVFQATYGNTLFLTLGQTKDDALDKVKELYPEYSIDSREIDSVDAYEVSCIATVEQ